VYGQSDWYPARDAATLSAMDWTYFSLGFVLIASIKLITSPFLNFFPPCLVKWVTVLGAALFFYLFMSAYMDAKFEDD